jgi:tetratricopeptide (TPR) repeat protein
MKELVSMRRTTLCFVIAIAGLYGLLYFDITRPLFVIIAGCIVLCIASMYFLSNAYVIYISEKILSLYNKPDGEYVIIPDNSKWLFWLYLFYNPYIWKIGIKAKKNGNFLELSGIKEDRFHWSTSPSIFRFIFFDNYNSCNSSHFDFNRFGFINYEPTGVILFTYDKGVWLFKLIRGGEDSHCEYDDFNEAYENASKHSHNHLMRIYFGGMNLDYKESEEEKIFYNIITQTNENKIIRKEIKEDSIIEYYYDDYKKDGNWYDPWLVIEKITNTKEGFYFYNMRGNSYFLFDLNIKEFMQKNGIYPRGLFEYGEDKELNYGSKCDGIMVYCLNGNYFMLQWDKEHGYVSSLMPHEYASIGIKPITLEKYIKILEDDCKYQREKKNLDDYTEAIKIKPDDNKILFDRAWAYAGKGNIDGAIADYTNVLKIKPDDYYALNNRGAEYASRGDIDLAIADYTEAIKIKPDYHYALSNRGNNYADKGDIDLAIADYTEAIKIKPDYHYALYRRGLAYADKGDFDSAIADYTEALRIKPDDYEILNLRGLAYADNGDGLAYADKDNFDRAIADYTEALRIKPDAYYALRNRGLAYYDSGHFDRAIADYTEALRIKPDYYSALNDRGVAYSDKGDFDSAIVDYTEALKIKSDYVSALNNRGNAYTNKGDFERAIEDWKAVLKMDPNNVNARNSIEKHHQENGKKEEN